MEDRIAAADAELLHDALAERRERQCKGGESDHEHERGGHDRGHGAGILAEQRDHHMPGARGIPAAVGGHVAAVPSPKDPADVPDFRARDSTARDPREPGTRQNGDGGGPFEAETEAPACEDDHPGNADRDDEPDRAIAGQCWRTKSGERNRRADRPAPQRHGRNEGRRSGHSRTRGRDPVSGPLRVPSGRCQQHDACKQHERFRSNHVGEGRRERRQHAPSPGARLEERELDRDPRRQHGAADHACRLDGLQCRHEQVDPRGAHAIGREHERVHRSDDGEDDHDRKRQRRSAHVLHKQRAHDRPRRDAR